MKADFETAAIKATQTLIDYHVTSAPIDPMPILKKIPGVLVITFAEMSNTAGLDRNNLISLCGADGKAAITSVLPDNGKLKYVVAYNQFLPFAHLQRELARELGHIVLGHDGTRPELIRTAESVCFAQHLICPRPLIHAIQSEGINLTTEVLGNATGCFEQCLSCMQETPGAHVPAEMNRAVKDQFADYLNNLLSYLKNSTAHDNSKTADFGQFMDHYVE